MGDKVTVEWCPSCSSWNRTDLIGRDITKACASSGALGSLEFDYFRKTHRCRSCGEGFVTVKPAASGRPDHWSVNAELSKIRQLLRIGRGDKGGNPEALVFET